MIKSVLPAAVTFIISAITAPRIRRIFMAAAILAVVVTSAACGTGGAADAPETFSADEKALPDNSINEIYTRYGLKVPLPGDFEDKVVVTPQNELPESFIIEFYQTASKEINASYGWLFTITRCTADELVTDYDNPGGTYYFARGGGWYYALMRPTSVEVDMSDANIVAEYERLQNKAGEVMEAFIEANGLEKFTSADIDEAKGYIKHILNIDGPEGPFATFVLPGGWEIGNIPDGGGQFMLPPAKGIFEDGKQIASIAASRFVIYPDVPEDRFFHMVYCDFMNSSMADWDSGYRPVAGIGPWVAAIDRVNISIPKNGGLEREEYSCYAVLAYDTDALAYIVISFDRDYAITEETLIYIAQSTRLTAARSGEDPGGDFTVNAPELQSVLYDMFEKGKLPDSPFTVDITGLSAPVTLGILPDGGPVLTSITAYGKKLSVGERIVIYGNCSVKIYEAGGAVVFERLYYKYGDTYLIWDGGTYESHPGEENSVMFYKGEDGGLKYCRSANKFNAVRNQTTVLETAFGRGDFLEEFGSVKIAGGELILSEPEKTFTISDKYDLDAQFNDIYGGGIYASIDYLFAANIIKASGSAEPLLLGEYKLGDPAIKLLAYSRNGVPEYYIATDSLNRYKTEIALPHNIDPAGSGPIALVSDGGRAYLYVLAFYGRERYFRYSAERGEGGWRFAYDTELAYEDMAALGIYKAEKTTVTTLEGVKKLCDDKIISKNAYDFLWNLLSGQSAIPEYNSVVISDFAVSYYTPGEDYTLYFDFTVTSSGLETLPTGRYHKELRDIRDCFMHDPADPSVYTDINTGKFAGIEEAEMVKSWIWSIYVWDCPDFGEYTGYLWIHNYLCNYYGGIYGLAPDEYFALAEEKFGVVNGDASGIAGLLNDSGYGERYEAGALGGFCVFRVTDCVKTGGVTVVTVRFYADCNALLPSIKVAYKLAAGGVWLGCELLEDSPNAPIGMRKFSEIN